MDLVLGPQHIYMHAHQLLIATPQYYIYTHVVTHLLFLWSSSTERIESTVLDLMEIKETIFHFPKVSYLGF